MENKKLQHIWNDLDREITHRSGEELNTLLQSKIRKTLNKYLLIIGMSILASLGLLIFLLISSIHRQHDLLYMINNIILAILVLISLISALYAWQKIESKRYNLPLRDWLQERIQLLSGWLRGKSARLCLFTIPLLFVLTLLSIHVYFEEKTLVEVMHTEESLVGLLFGAAIGLFVAFYTAHKIRMYQLQNLKFLENLYEGICG